MLPMSVSCFEVSNFMTWLGGVHHRSPGMVLALKKSFTSVEGHGFSCDISNGITCLFSVLQDSFLIAFLDNSLFSLSSELLADNCFRNSKVWVNWILFILLSV